MTCRSHFPNSRSFKFTYRESEYSRHSVIGPLVTWSLFRPSFGYLTTIQIADIGQPDTNFSAIQMVPQLEFPVFISPLNFLFRILTMTKQQLRKKKTTTKMTNLTFLKRIQTFQLKNFWGFIIQVYSDLKSGLLWILNSRKEVGLQMVQILKGIWNREAQPIKILTNGCHFVKHIWNLNNNV